MSRKNERAFRLIYSAIAGSTMSARDIRRLVEDMSADGDLIRMLQESLWKLSDELEYKFGNAGRGLRAPVDDNDMVVDIIMQKASSRKIAKSILWQMLGSIEPRFVDLLSPSDTTMRGMIEGFVSYASPSKVSELMERLDIDINVDPFLGGIDRKSLRGR